MSKVRLFLAAAMVVATSASCWAMLTPAKASNCCGVPGAACCYAGSPCCEAVPDCCFPGSPCCDGGDCCLLK